MVHQRRKQLCAIRRPAPPATERYFHRLGPAFSVQVIFSLLRFILLQLILELNLSLVWMFFYLCLSVFSWLWNLI